MKSERSEQYERSSRRERSEFITTGGLGGAVSPPMGSRGEAPGNFAFLTFYGSQKTVPWQVLTLNVFNLQFSGLVVSIKQVLRINALAITKYI